VTDLLEFEFGQQNLWEHSADQTFFHPCRVAGLNKTFQLFPSLYPQQGRRI